MTKAAKRKRSRRPRGFLAVIAGLFLASSLVRISESAGKAEQSDETADLSAPASTLVDKNLPACTDAEHIRQLLADLQARESAIAQEELRIADRQQALNVAETHIRENLAALVKAEKELAATMNLARTASEKDLERLTRVYENMKAKEAVALFEAMAPEFSAGFLARMRPDAAAAIMVGLEPQTAYSISVILAGRNALVPTE